MSSQVLPHHYVNGPPLGVPDHLLSCDTSCDPMLDSFPFYEPTTLSSSKEMGVAGLDQFPFSATGLGDPSFDLWGTTTAPPSLPSPPHSSSFPPNCTGQYIDLDALCEMGIAVQGDVSSPTVSAHPPSPLSAPLSPEEQEIRDIMSTLGDPAPFVSNGYAPLPSSPLSSVPVTNSTPILTQYLSSGVTPPTPVEPVSPIEPISPPTSNYIPSPSPSLDSPQSPIKPVIKRRQSSRRKLSVSKKKERKKEQNKTAALRYRQKKKDESRVIEERQEALEAVNRRLKAEVQGLEGEIGYLKQLWAEVCQARRPRPLDATVTTTTASCLH